MLVMFCLLTYTVVLVNLGIVDATRSSVSAEAAPAVSSQEKQNLEALAKEVSSHELYLKELERWWDKTHSSNPKVNLVRLNKQVLPWACPRDDLNTIVQTSAIKSYITRFENNSFSMMYYLFKSKIPMNSDNTNVSHVSMTLVPNECIAPCTALKVCSIRSNMFKYYSHLAQIDFPSNLGTKDSLAVFANDEEVALCITRLAIRHAFEAKSSIFMLGLFLTLLFRRMEGGQFIFDDAMGEYSTALSNERYSVCGEWSIFKAHWEKKNMKHKNLNGAFIGLTGIPAKRKLLFTEVLTAMKPQNPNFTDEMFKNFKRGIINSQTIEAEFLLFKKIFTEAKRISRVKDYYGFSWIVFAFYDDNLHHISSYGEFPSHHPVPEEQREADTISLLRKYVAISTRLFNIFQAMDRC
ncbi:hypothetical protein PAEPH01_0201 [Pancytospora epiphaga]|nr:hypothetical protein PAEPH01_0201 [Pancytospora epiphaga]